MERFVLQFDHFLFVNIEHEEQGAAITIALLPDLVPASGSLDFENIGRIAVLGHALRHPCLFASARFRDEVLRDTGFEKILEGIAVGEMLDDRAGDFAELRIADDQLVLGVVMGKSHCAAFDAPHVTIAMRVGLL
jgi:hypothetical protein